MSGRYIVVFKETVGQEQVDKHAKEIDDKGGKVTAKYGKTLNGFAAEIPDELLNNFQSSFASEIDYIEPDGVATTQSLV